MDLRQRFFSKIAKGPGECIDWTGAAREKGYGLISVDNALRSVTHVSWFLKHGVWPTKHILHTCDRPSCVNPEHLFEGTDADNAADRDVKGRHGTQVLTGLEVSEIIALTETRMSIEEIGALFGVTPGYVSNLRHGRFRGRGQRSAKPTSCTTVMVRGVEMTLKEAAAATGVAQHTIRGRMARGLSGDDLFLPPHAAPRKPYGSPPLTP